jgi:hypothetical protein
MIGYARVMPRSVSKLTALRKRLPKNKRLPKELATLAQRMDLSWTDPRPLLNAGKSVLDSLLPFRRLGDGGVIALWWHESEPCVVHCDSEGQFAVIAVSFPDFLQRLAHPTADFAERLELDAPVDASARPKPIPAKLSRAFSKWVEGQSLAAKPDASAAASELAEKLQGIARTMLRDGLSKVYKLRDFHWTVELRVERKLTTWNVTYLDYGKWIPLPDRYDLVALLPDLTRLLKNPRARRFDLSIWKDGHVFVNRGNQLTIQPQV